MITSASNEQMKYVRQVALRAKTRREDRVFLAEGIRMIREVPGDRLVRAYCSESFLKAGENASFAEEIGAEVVKDSVFRSVSETISPQGILAVVRQAEYTWDDLVSEGRPVVILESLQDPGNLGTIFRTGEGAGIGGILMNRGTADPYGPKTVRATMGSVFRVPHLVCDSIAAAASRLKAEGYRLYAAHLAGTNLYTDEDYRSTPCAFLIGNEGNGLTEETSALADVLVRIPMEGRVESLNAAVAASLLMYEAFRQRMQKS